MNKICRRFEQEFDGYIRKHSRTVKFDYNIMRGQTEYSYAQFNAVKRLYEDFNKRLKNYVVFTDYERVDKYDSYAEMSMMTDEFARECDKVCSNRDALCNIVLDLCYTRKATKKFAWSICGQDIIHNLLLKNMNTISFPVLDQDGDIEYCGDRFSVISKQIEVTL